MGLDHHRATGGQGRGGVATGHREGQREIAGTEYRHRPQGHLALAQVGTRQGLALGQGIVDPHVQPFAGPYHAGEGAQLGAGAATFALDARLGQATFSHGAVDQGIAQRFDLRGDGFEELCPLLERGFAVGIERRPGQGACLGHVFAGAAEVGRFQRLAGGWVDGTDGFAAAGYRRLADQQVACEGHGASFGISNKGDRSSCGSGFTREAGDSVPGTGFAGVRG